MARQRLLVSMCVSLRERKRLCLRRFPVDIAAGVSEVLSVMILPPQGVKQAQNMVHIVLCNPFSARTKDKKANKTRNKQNLKYISNNF